MKKAIFTLLFFLLGLLSPTILLKIFLWVYNLHPEFNLSSVIVIMFVSLITAFVTAQYLSNYIKEEQTWK